MLHLVAVNQTISVAEMWRLLQTKLRMSSAHHPQIDGQTNAANRVVEMALRCTIHSSRDPALMLRRSIPTGSFRRRNTFRQAGKRMECITKHHNHIIMLKCKCSINEMYRVQNVATEQTNRA